MSNEQNSCIQYSSYTLWIFAWVHKSDSALWSLGLLDGYHLSKKAITSYFLTNRKIIASRITYEFAIIC